MYNIQANTELKNLTERTANFVSLATTTVFGVPNTII